MSIILLWSLIASTSEAQDHIRFQKGSLSSLLNFAKAEGKPLLLYATSKWCGPCLKMEQRTFREDSVIRFINENFVPVKAAYEDAEGLKMQKKYKMALPAFVVLDHTGEELFTFAGFQTGAGLLVKLRESRSPEQRMLKKMETQFASGRHDVPFLLDYLKLAEKRKPAMTAEIYKKLVMSASEADFVRYSLVKYSQRYISSDELPDYKYIRLHRVRTDSLLGQGASQNLLNRAMYGTLYNASRQSDRAVLDRAMEKLAISQLPDQNSIKWQTELDYYFHNKQYNNLLKSLEDTSFLALGKSPDEIRNAFATNTVLRKVTDPKVLASAMGYVKNMADAGGNVQQLTMLGQLEQLSGNRAKAISYYEQALSDFRKQRPDQEPLGILNLLEDIKNDHEKSPD
ncbi:thioredoxin family protein [Pedobacter sp. SYP-B3415]|uniref:thioredoxin family protein n=1 Tax=Pedobacter sp. SYP-B3415 TaxID=2496641 RepID=UPI0013EC817A|nr:thioredoxin family protein [Pedobacter sp. SYP-B3415]